MLVEEGCSLVVASAFDAVPFAPTPKASSKVVIAVAPGDVARGDMASGVIVLPPPKPKASSKVVATVACGEVNGELPEGTPFSFAFPLL